MQNESMPTGPAGGAPPFSRRAEEVDNFLMQGPPSFSAQIEPASDPTLVHQLQRFNYGIDSSVRFGRVNMVLPHANWYRVALEDMGGELPCVKVGFAGGYRLMGARDCSNITPDSRVIVIVPPGASYGFILGVTTDLTEDGNHTYSDWVSQGSNVGILRNRYYSEYMRILSDEGGAMMNASGRPVDALAFDWTQTTETGLTFHLDPEMLYLRASEECGVMAFRNNSQLRLAGRNLDVWTGAREEEDRHDEGELYTYKGESPYPWEMSGCFSAGRDITEETSDEDVLHKEPLAKLEPIETDLQPFMRYQEYGGYLGQPKMRMVVIPPESKANTSDTRQFEDEDKDICVFREQVSMDGGYALESAKHVYIRKSTVMPAPKRLRPAIDYKEDGCDSAENDNYKFAGQYGGGDEHKVGDPVNGEGMNRNLFTAAAILDYHAHAFNWKGLHPFHYHEKDFYLPEESDIPGEATYMPPYDDLSRYFWLPAPDPQNLKVDHRYNQVKFWKLMQHISLTEDGSIIIQAGQGEQIILGAGGVRICSPGKILIESGNTTAILAGDDAIIRAYNSVDITSTEKDVRIKAENNFMALAGNSGKGALLLENRSTSQEHVYPNEGGEKIEGSGIVFKAPNAVIASLAKDIYQRCNIEGQGQIVLDGDQGNANVRVVANNVFRFIRSQARDGFGTPAAPMSVNVFQYGSNKLGATTYIQGPLQVDGFSVFRSSVNAINGHFASSVGGRVSRILNRDLENARLDAAAKLLSDQLEAQTKDYKKEIEDKFYQDKQIGSREMIKKISFSLRPEKQYGTFEFLLPQSHWQVLNNVIKAGKTWQEKDVEYQKGTKHQPWPGKKMWSESNTLLTLPASELKLFDLDKGHAKDRGEVYENAELGKFERKTPSSSYSIIPSSD